MIRPPRSRLLIVAALCGVMVMLTGVALVYVPAALILAGAVTIVAAYIIETIRVAEWQADNADS